MGDQEQEPKLFTLKEAERTRLAVEPILIEAVENRRELGKLAERLGAIAQRVSLSGGLVVNYEETARLRREHDRMALAIKAALEKIESTGCMVKDLDLGLLDFPAVLNNEEIYLCWRLGEDRIRFWHRQNEGYAGRKPLDPRNAGGKQPVQ